MLRRLAARSRRVRIAQHATPEDATFVPLPELPLELWDYAIDHLWNDPQSLKACSLTCHAWVSVTRIHLFEIIMLRSKEWCPRFQSVLGSSMAAGTNIARYVRQIDIIKMSLCSLDDQLDGGGALLLLNLFRQLPHVQRLQLQDVDVETHLSQSRAISDAAMRPVSCLFPVPHLRSLVLSAVAFNTVDDLWRLISAFPRLSLLCISHSLLWGTRPDTTVESPELEKIRDNLRHLDQLTLSATLSPQDLIRYLDRRSSAFRIGGNAHFGWHRYVEEERCAFFELLRASASTIKDLNLRIRFQSNFVGELTRLEFLRLETLSLHLAASPSTQDARCTTLPTFLHQLGTTNIRNLKLCFSLFHPDMMYWTFVDWDRVDEALVSLHQHRPELAVTLTFTYIPVRVSMDQAALDATDVLAGYLSGALGAGLRIHVECDLMSPGQAVARKGPRRWLSLP